MTIRYIDTDVLSRFLTGDDPRKQAEAAALFQLVAEGDASVAAPVTVIADAVFVLASKKLYGLPCERVRDLLAPLVRLPAFLVVDRPVVLRALDIFAERNLDFGDAMLIAAMENAGVNELYSYDQHFDRIEGVVRLTPDAAT